MLACRPWLVVAFAAASLAGCEPRVARHPVEGVVTLDGKPLKGASVAFMPKAKGCPGTAATDADGRFALREMDRHNGIAPGEYRVVVFLAKYSKPNLGRGPLQAKGDGEPADAVEIVEPEPTIVAYVVPERYGRAETSGLRVDITGPTNGVTLALTTEK